jgi:hypothetical protein
MSKKICPNCKQPFVKMRKVKTKVWPGGRIDYKTMPDIRAVYCSRACSQAAYRRRKYPPAFPVVQDV